MADKFKFGDPIESVYASTDNPRKYSLFVRQFVRTGRFNPGKFAELTDGKGEFWSCPIDSINLISVRVPCKLICWSLNKGGRIRPPVCPECSEEA